MLILRIICLCQLDIKSIIAISSVVHIGIILIRILLIIKLRIFGRYYMIISHGFISSGLFYLVNLIYVQTNKRLIFINKGIMQFSKLTAVKLYVLKMRSSGSLSSLRDDVSLNCQ